jgi:hypothetical protein
MGYVPLQPSSSSYPSTNPPHSYTHYWNIRHTASWSNNFPQVVVDTQLIVSSAGIGLDGEDPGLPPVIDAEKGIHLNAKSKPHESFILGPEGLKGFTFCKTARKPYDLVVTAILLRATQLAENSIQVRYVVHRLR